VEARRTDFLVGVFILVTIGIMVGTVIITSGLGRVQHVLYMRTETAQDLTSDTRVYLQGLAVGRVRQVYPQVDSGPEMAFQRMTDPAFVDATQAVDMILSGAEHASVYRFLENQRRRAKQADSTLWK